MTRETLGLEYVGSVKCRSYFWRHFIVWKVTLCHPSMMDITACGSTSNMLMSLHMEVTAVKV
jgi:hypothetical protein